MNQQKIGTKNNMDINKIRLDSILLFTFVVPFIMNYRLSSGSTPYWLFGLIFFFLLLNLVIDVYPLKERAYVYLKRSVLALIVLLVLGSAFSAAIIVRHQTSPVYMIHDIIIQQEAAIRFLLHGRNPYEATYFGTPLEQWNYHPSDVNPALYHFVMEPFYLIFAIPFYLISTRTIGFFDGRIPLVFLFLASGVFAFFLTEKEKNRRLFVILLLLSPALLPYVLEGRSDLFMFAFFIASLFFLKRKKFILSSILLAFAFGVKQSIWFIFPFHFLYTLQITKNIIKTIKTYIPFIVILSFINVPFLLWNKKAYIDSTILYLSGSTPNSYPVSGYGFGKVLESIGIIKDAHAYYPFIIWQFLLGLPLLFFLLKYQRKYYNLSSMVFCYGIFLFVYWYFSRYFNNSHVAYLSIVFATAYFLQGEDKT